MRWHLVAFDLYGTLLDVSGLLKKLEPLCGPAEELLGRWRKAQLERTWELNQRGAYEPFDKVTAWALEKTAPEIDAPTREKMCATWLALPPHGDAGETLARLKAKGVRTAVLSNGTKAMIRAALDAADISVDEIRSADEVRAYKTDPRVYALLSQKGTLFVSGNAWDAEGAKKSGLDVAYIDRGGPSPALEPDLRVGRLLELPPLVR